MKKIDAYILKKFLPLFVGAFFICLFVFMMQFTWRYVDELIGKGLTLDILGQFFWYMSITLVPMALPLAVLLSALITFGNMGEQLELLSMKAAGVPLIRIMRPVLVVVLALTGISFYFQNFTAPRAQINLSTLLFSMKQAQPAVEIPEGVFYNEIPGINLYVQRKNAETGKLYQVIIYKTDQGFDNAQIVLADSGRLEMSADKLHLKLELWSGTQAQALQQGSGTSAMGSLKLPYDRETFSYKEVIIDFDSNFSMMDKEMLRDMPQTKNMSQISLSVDSMNHTLDSVGNRLYDDMKLRWYALPRLAKADSLRLAGMKVQPFDSALTRVPPDRLATARQRAANEVRSVCSELEWKSVTSDEGDRLVRRHWVVWHQKMTLALSCLFFFFVGAPLGAIIRKGGLGLPAVISVLIFIFYYIIDTSGMKMARDGSWNMLYGMWVSSVVLIPFGIFLTYKSNKDSVVFNGELYVSFFRRLLGLRAARHITRKEVVIDDPDYPRLADDLGRLAETCREYLATASLAAAPSYRRLFFSPGTDSRVAEISERLEQIVEELSNSREHYVLSALNRLPVLFTTAHLAPFGRRWPNVLCGVFFPLGLVLWLRVWRFRLRLQRDLRQVAATCDYLQRAISGTGCADEAADTAPGTAAALKKRRRRRDIAIAVAVVLVAFLAGWYAYRYVRKNQQRKPVPERQVPATPGAAPVAPPAAPAGERMLPMPRPRL